MRTNMTLTDILNMMLDSYQKIKVNIWKQNKKINTYIINPHFKGNAGIPDDIYNKTVFGMVLYYDGLNIDIIAD